MCTCICDVRICVYAYVSTCMLNAVNAFFDDMHTSIYFRTTSDGSRQRYESNRIPHLVFAVTCRFFMLVHTQLVHFTYTPPRSERISNTRSICEWFVLCGDARIKHGIPMKTNIRQQHQTSHQYMKIRLNVHPCIRRRQTLHRNARLLQQHAQTCAVTQTQGELGKKMRKQKKTKTYIGISITSCYTCTNLCESAQRLSIRILLRVEKKLFYINSKGIRQNEGKSRNLCIYNAFPITACYEFTFSASMHHFDLCDA